MDAKTFGAFILERRKSQDKTQAELAQLIGVTDKAVSRWERGLGFPDINTMEPLAEALGVTLLELMRSEMIEDRTEDQTPPTEKTYTSAEVSEMMCSVEELHRQQLHQDKIAFYLAIPVIIIVAVLFRLSGHANLPGAVFMGFIGAGAVICGYYFWENRSDSESRRVYGAFGAGLAGLFLMTCSLLIPDTFRTAHLQEIYLIRCLVEMGVTAYLFSVWIKKLHGAKKHPVVIVLLVCAEILILAWFLHSFAAQSIQTAITAMG